MSESPVRQRLEWLAGAYRIDPAYDDVWGRSHEVSDAGLRALLGQLGAPAASDAELDQSLAQTHPRYWRRLAEPVIAVTLPATRLSVLVRLPRQDGGGRLSWRLSQEAGEALEGEVELDRLLLKESAQVEGTPYESRLLDLAIALEPGYHRLELAAAGARVSVLVIAAPSTCFLPEAVTSGARVWGWAVQLNNLRSPRNWGIGDFTDLLSLIDVAAARGASAIGLNPLHARFPHDPSRSSPYAPSSRLWLDLLAVDVEAIDEFGETQSLQERFRSADFQARIRSLREAELVDIEGVAALKHEAFGELYAHFRREHLERGTGRALAFRAFQQESGAPLRRHALFEALQERFHAEDPEVWGWQVWPEALREPGSEAVRALEAQMIERIEYYEYLQWQAAAQLARARERCKERGLAIGLYLDLAVSVDRSGSDCWSFADCYADKASVGAPPDEFNQMGQDWGLTPLIPEPLRERGYEPFVLALRATMRNAGALRIDHAMGLMRLYWVPPGASARDGGYVQYPLDEMLAIVALESHRNRCLVIGEDLGTVPDAVRAAFAQARVLSYRLLYFEREESGAFKAPAAYPRDALVSIGTHDLPTLAGWWAAHELKLRIGLGLFPDEESYEAQMRDRVQDRRRLVEALVRERLLPDGTDAEAVAEGPLTEQIIFAAHRYLAASPARLMLVQPEDWLGVLDQNNLPGTVDAHPNWRRKLPLSIDELGSDARGERLAAALAAERAPLSAAATNGGGDTAERYTGGAGAGREEVAGATSVGGQRNLNAQGSGNVQDYENVQGSRKVQGNGSAQGNGHAPSNGNARGNGNASRAARIAPRSALSVPPGSAPQARIPRSTYRMQLNSEFRFEDAVRALPFLARLGVGDLYCSPIQRARPGSTHGYDIVDHGTINPELGGEAGFDQLSGALREQGMGLLFDVVPNHMGVLGGDNAWWMDVLEHGEASLYARFFDIEWHPADKELAGKVLIPLLGDHYGHVLDRGELALRFEAEAGGFALGYYQHRLPIDPRESAALLQQAAQSAALAAASGDLRSQLSLLSARFADLPTREGAAQGLAAQRARDAAAHKQALADLASEQPAVLAAIEEVVAGMNEDSPAARDALHALIEKQAWRLAYWRVAADEINYRRFFDINELAGLRMEDESVFEATHERVLELAASGIVTGLRIDHPDGLFDPGEYFARLQAGYARRTGASLEADGDRPARPLYVAIEKIAASHEHLPPEWPIHGTTGYRFAAVVNGLMVDASSRTRIDRIWRAFTGERAEFEDMVYEGKRMIMREALASELGVLTAELLRIARADRRTRDYTFNALRRALAEVAARLPVYRTYLTDRESRQDRRYIEWAVGQAVGHSRAADTTVFGFVREVLLGRAPEGSPPALGARVRRLARRFQQFTSPVAAKGVEDTALYRFNRLISLNDVGSEPETFGMSIKAFHGANADRAANWPHTMLATSTHDNKRSADVRARINVLSEMPAAWRLLLRRWRLMNRSRRPMGRGRSKGTVAGLAPSLNDEYLLYQTLLGSFRPQDASGEALAMYTERIERYMLKAAREAKLRTSWVRPDQAYEDALTGFVRGILAPSPSNAFLADFAEQVETIAWFGALNSLAITTLENTLPGVPDLYQGNECFDFSLVDPDNRRPVDFEGHAAMLDSLEARVRNEGLEAVAEGLSRDPRADETKLFVTWRLLQLRRAHPELFRDGGYLPLHVTGPGAEHLVAYARHAGSQVLVVVVGRLFAKLLGTAGRLPEGKEVWADAELPLEGLEGLEVERFVDQLSGRSHRVEGGRLVPAQVFAGLPAAVLLGDLPQESSPAL